MTTLNRRSFVMQSLAGAGAVIGAGVGLGAWPVLAVAGNAPLVQVVKDPSCGCCGAWVAVLEQAGFTVETRHADNDALYAFKARLGISPDLASCHTALVDGYVIEGHVPPADIRKLLDTRPDAIGLAVPGMPFGSPGMGPESERDAYDVLLVGRDGKTGLFAHYPAA